MCCPLGWISIVGLVSCPQRYVKFELDLVVGMAAGELPHLEHSIGDGAWMEASFLVRTCSLVRGARWERLSGAYWPRTVDHVCLYTGLGRSIHCSLAAKAFQMGRSIDRMSRRSSKVGQIRCWGETMFVVPDHMSLLEMRPRDMAQSRSKDALAWRQQAGKFDLMLDECMSVR